uniref:Uncharacterized protein n=1 Tax=Cacopsylla melanoneura TaxID=428564 RepID=A0A8D8L963_9HEMI
MKYLGNRQNFNHLIMHEMDVELPGSTTVFTTEAELPPQLDQSIQYIYESLIPSFRNPKYRNRWIESYKKGYDVFMKEIHELGPPHFINMGEKDNIVRGVEGALVWEAIIKLLECLGETGFEDLLHRIDNLPENYKKEDLVKKETVPPNYHVDLALRPVVEEIKDANTTKNENKRSCSP